MSFETPLPPYNASDPHATFLNASCLDFLLIELVPMAYRIVDELASASSADLTEDESGDENIASKEGRQEGAEGERTGILDEEERNEVVFRRLEALGYRVGQGLAERFSRDRPRFTDTLDAIKFLCKDLWTLVFRKQIDNLKTNHRGVYVLTDHLFQPFRRMSTEAGGPAVARARPFLHFPCGVIRGALASMDINATVHAETLELPGATFQIKTVGAKA